MDPKSLQNTTLAIVMGGGAGTRLFPLTQKRAKPAVPLGGKYRLVDIPISNCLNSGFRQLYVLTQFNSESLHRHIAGSYKLQESPPGATRPSVRVDAREVLTDREKKKDCSCQPEDEPHAQRGKAIFGQVFGQSRRDK